MAGCTVTIVACTEGFGVNTSTLVSMVLVLMVPKMLSRRTGFVLAIASYCRPGKVKWQKNEHENGKPAAHEPNSIRI